MLEDTAQAEHHCPVVLPHDVQAFQNPDHDEKDDEQERET
jgi:hypothetical protein